MKNKIILILSIYLISCGGKATLWKCTATEKAQADKFIKECIEDVPDYTNDDLDICKKEAYEKYCKSPKILISEGQL